VEHEYVVRGPGGVLDFRTLVDTLDLGVRADPTDPHAHRGSWGGVVTADGAEAEVATPPVTIGPGATGAVAALARSGRTALEERLGTGIRLEGYSTHVNVSAPRRGDRALALRFAHVFAPSLMLLLDRTDSPGLLVRPRPGRLELGGEFADDADLAVALTFAVGGVLASLRMRRREEEALAVELRLERAVERFGWFVSRHAPGHDLYARGRDTLLTPAAGGPRRAAGEHLALTWAAARLALVGVVDAAELAAVDAVVGDDRRLPRP
jgi:hypothetical protein